MAVLAQYPVHAPRADEEPRVLLEGISWATYVMLRDSIDSSGIRMTYLEGRLEIMTTSREREVDKTQIARFVELFCLERDIPLFGYGSMTFRKEAAERGLEPDECARGLAVRSGCVSRVRPPRRSLRADRGE
jgi:Uma2 family endonuclease